jgi:hypothetical protein
VIGELAQIGVLRHLGQRVELLAQAARSCDLATWNRASA